MLPTTKEMQNVIKQCRKLVAAWMRMQMYVYPNEMKEGHRDINQGDQC